MPTRQRRRRRRGPTQFEAERKSKMPFPLNLIFNIKMFYFVFIIVMIASMAAVGLASNGGSNQPGPSPIDITNTPVATPQTKVFASPAPVIDGTQGYIATLKTNKGDIQIKLATDTPQTVNSFYFLTQKNYYDGLAFFYLDHAFWAQAGDPACNPELQQTCTGLGDAGYKLPVEPNPSPDPSSTPAPQGAFPLHGQHTKYAVVAPTVQGASDVVSGGQFRILFADDHRLDGTESVFGTVVGGQQILENAANLHLCTALTQSEPGCAQDLSSAIIIQDVTIAPAS